MAILYRSKIVDGREHFECPIVYFDQMLKVANVNPKAPMPVAIDNNTIFKGPGSRKGIVRYDKRELREMVERWRGR